MGMGVHSRSTVEHEEGKPHFPFSAAPTTSGSPPFPALPLSSSTLSYALSLCPWPAAPAFPAAPSVLRPPTCSEDQEQDLGALLNVFHSVLPRLPMISPAP